MPRVLLMMAYCRGTIMACNGLYGDAPPPYLFQSSDQIHERVGISLVEV